MRNREREPRLPRTDAPPDIKGKLAAIEDAMLRFPEPGPGVGHGALLLKLIASGEVSGLAEFETWLRSVDSQVYLLAMPPDYYAGLLDEREARAIMLGDREPEFLLVVEPGGVEAAAQLLAEFGLSREENTENLHRTGILLVQ